MSEMVGLRSRVGVELVPSPDITVQRKEITVRQHPGMVPRTKLQRSNRQVELSDWLHVFRGISPRKKRLRQMELSDWLHVFRGISPRKKRLRVPTVEDFRPLQEQFCFLSEHGVMIPAKGSSIYDYPRGKVGVPFPLFEAGLCMLTSDFFDMIVHHYDFSIDELTPSVVNKIVGFELICWSLGAEAEISLEMALCVHYRGKLCHWEVDLLKTLLPPISEKHMQELVGLLPTERGNVGYNRPASSSQPGVGATFPAHSLVFVSTDILVVGQAGISTTPIRRKRSVRVVLSSNEETEYFDVSLRPHKRRNTMSIPKFLGGIGDVLGDGFSVLGRKEIVVVLSSSKTSPSSFIDSLMAYLGACSVLRGALGVSGGSPPSDIPYMVEKMRTASHPLVSEAYVPGWAVTKYSLF
ncbi:unnamed protein product [Lactuca saligna]|uniref:Uncharacterized protein n=1 Tax=Lactuca saligna TaxID=75948 RepID=A0AA36EH61_LACSI|nr:unnamed protein product [Lactuca saligna]